MAYKCNDLKDRWPEYLYRELNEHEQALFAQHLRQCPSCQQEEQTWKKLFTRLDVLAADDGTDKAPPELVYRVKRQIHFYQDWSRQTYSAYRSKIAASVAVCALFFGLLWVGDHSLQKISASNQYIETVSQSLLEDFYSPRILQMYKENGIFAPTNTSRPRLTLQDNLRSQHKKTISKENHTL